MHVANVIHSNLPHACILYMPPRQIKVQETENIKKDAVRADDRRKKTGRLREVERKDRSRDRREISL